MKRFRFRPSIIAVAGFSALSLVIPGCVTASVADEARPTLLVVAGAPGQEDYVAEFSQAVTNWVKAADLAKARVVTVGVPVRLQAPSATNAPTPTSGDSVPLANVTDRERLEQAIAAEAAVKEGELWIVLIGHGTFDGKQAKFNLQGPDVAAADLAEWLKPMVRSVALINGSAASAPFINTLAGTNRVVVTATRSGNELNYARFGRFFAEAVVDSSADLDKDGQTSLLEAFISASKRTAEFYKNENRLVTEHALLDDNGDGLGTPADWFRGVRAEKKAVNAVSVDGRRANQMHFIRSNAEQQLSAEARQQRDAIEARVEDLRGQRKELGDEEYFKRLEGLFAELARVYGISRTNAAPVSLP
jgi:hypothetical protein